MITGFPEETCILNEYELSLVDPMIKGLSSKIGKDNSITSTIILQSMKDAGYKLDGSRMRKLVNHIRRNDLVKNLIATSKGYYIATTEAEVRKFIQSLDERERAIREVREALQRQIIEVIN